MTTELWMLAWSAALCALLWIPYIVSRVLTWGIVDTVGYPQDPPALPGWAQRSQRAHGNMVENLAPFAAVVLIAHMAGANNAMTAFGAILFFWARVGHAIVFIAGIPWLRTLAFVAGWVGIILVFLALYDAPLVGI